MFKKCYLNTLQTTPKVFKDGTAFVFTGDIEAMWLRDPVSQIRHYLLLTKMKPSVQKLFEGLIRRQMFYISIDPYANAFNLTPSSKGHKDDMTEQNPWVWERKYEIDSSCYPIELDYLYWNATGLTSITFPNGKDEKVALFYEPKNHIAERRYKPFGFKESGKLMDGKIEHILALLVEHNLMIESIREGLTHIIQN